MGTNNKLAQWYLNQSGIWHFLVIRNFADKPSLIVTPNWRYFVTCIQAYQIPLFANFDGLSSLVLVGEID